MKKFIIILVIALITGITAISLSKAESKTSASTVKPVEKIQITASESGNNRSDIASAD